MAKKNEKACCICGKAFFAPPSGRITCSPECAAVHRRGYLRGHPWSAGAKHRRRSDPAVKERMAELQPTGAAAALALPEGQRGPQHRAAKVWIMQAPDGTIHRAVNLLDWARDNYQLFEPDTPPEQAERAVTRIRTGISAVAQSMAGTRKGRPAMTYKGWRLLSVKDKTDTDQAAAVAEYQKKKEETEC